MHSFGHGMADKRASLGDSFSFQQSKISMNDVFIPMTAPQSSPVDIEWDNCVGLVSDQAEFLLRPQDTNGEGE